MHLQHLLHPGKMCLKNILQVKKRKENDIKMACTVMQRGKELRRVREDSQIFSAYT